MRPEEKVEKEFVKLAKLRGWRADKYEVTGEKGRLDRIVFLGKGKICFIEFKRPDGKGVLSEHQKKEMIWLWENQYQCVVRSDAQLAIKFCEGVLNVGF